MDEVKAKEVAVHFLKTASRAPMIYAALKAVAAADVDEAVTQLARFENAEWDAVYAVRASIYEKKGGLLISRCLQRVQMLILYGRFQGNILCRDRNQFQFPGYVSQDGL